MVRQSGSASVGKSPNASRAYTYGPPEPGTRLDKAPNVRARAMAPAVIRANATRLIGPYGANALGSANTPVPITEPITRAVAVGSPNWRPGAGWAGPVDPAGVAEPAGI